MTHIRKLSAPQIGETLLSYFRCQPGEAGAVHASLQPEELREKDDIPCACETLVAEKYSDENHQDKADNLSFRGRIQGGLCSRLPRR